MSGMLNLLGRKGEKPAFPANLLGESFPCIRSLYYTRSTSCNTTGDFAGGGMVAVVGIMMALFEREKSGLGQVIDIDMVLNSSRYTGLPL